MEAPYFQYTNFESQDTCNPEALKILRDITGVLTTATQRDKHVEHAPGTVEKSAMVHLTAAMLGSGLDDGKDLLDTQQRILHDTLVAIRECTDPLQTLDHLIDALDPEKKEKAFSVHRTTASKMVPRLTRDQLDKCIEEQYAGMFRDPSTSYLLSRGVNMAIDDTAIRASSKYMNKNYSYVVVGQTSTWQRGFTFSSEFDTINSLFMGVMHHDRKMNAIEKNDIRPWVKEVMAKMDALQAIGCTTGAVEGDRGFYSAEFFAAAYAGWLDANMPLDEQPRVVTPRKFAKDKEDFKLKFLLDPGSKQVFTYEMPLNPYTHPGLKEAVVDKCHRDGKGKFLVPVACIALVDEYDRKNNRTLDELRVEIRKVMDKMKKVESELEKAINTYHAHLRTFIGDAAKKPSFGRGARRKKFYDAEDKKLYRACFAAKDVVKKWVKRRAKLLKALMFFTISIRPGEDPASNPQEFIELARHYHERWCIENGFRDSKQNFLSQCRSRRPTVRTFHLLVSMMVYNRWQVARRREAWSRSRYLPKGNGGADGSPILYREKIEQQCPNLVTAVGFMVATWRTSIMSMVTAIIKKVEKNH